MPSSKQAAAETFAKWCGGENPLLVAHAPGRVNLVGDHTDYNGGLVLPMILDRSIYVALRPSSTGFHRLRSGNYQEEISFSPGGWPQVPDAHWASYIAGMIQELPPPAPVEMLIIGDVPLGAGLSSSAALEMAAGLALEALRGTPVDPLDLAQIGQRVEHQYLNVQCGVMDQIVSRVGRADHALFLDCNTLKLEHIPFRGKDAQFVIIDSRVKRKLADSKYNERRAECQSALQRIQNMDASIESLSQVERHHIFRLKEPVLQRRARHVLYENERVRWACDAIINKDWFNLGQILTASHISLRDDYEVSCEELDFLVATAEVHPEVYGARMMGGGFGGCTINLVRSESAHSFAESVTGIYEKKYQRKAHAHVLGTGIEAGVQWVDSNGAWA